MSVLEEIIEAHGGRERWRAVDVIRGSLSSGGFAFASRWQPFALRDLKIEVSPHTPRVVLHDFCKKGWRGVWTPIHVQIRDTNDSLIQDRHDPRAQFSRFVKQIRWDKLDILYFAGYALWNYLSFPFVLEWPGVTVAELRHADGSARLDVAFDPSVPTHSAAQAFHVDAARRLVRHDYTADPVGRWAKVANFCLAAEHVAGLRFTTRRKVYPRFGSRIVLPFPTLVWIEIDDLDVTMLKS